MNGLDTNIVLWFLLQLQPRMLYGAQVKLPKNVPSRVSIGNNSIQKAGRVKSSFPTKVRTFAVSAGRSLWKSPLTERPTNPNKQGFGKLVPFDMKLSHLHLSNLIFGERKIKTKLDVCSGSFERRTVLETNKFGSPTDGGNCCAPLHLNSSCWKTHRG